MAQKTGYANEFNHSSQTRRERSSAEKCGLGGSENSSLTSISKIVDLWADKLNWNDVFSSLSNHDYIHAPSFKVHRGPRLSNILNFKKTTDNMNDSKPLGFEFLEYKIFSIVF